ncbi:hypothetical protein ACFLU6_08280 [Acidobacteriota bacterium]
METFFNKILNLDRRWIFLSIFIATIVPFFFPLQLPVKVSEEVKTLYDYIETLGPESKPILISFDYEPQTAAENHPMALAVLRHLHEREVKIVAITLMPAGSGLALAALDKTAGEYNAKHPDNPKVYGKDYVFMGYGAGFALMMAKMGESFPNSFPKDYDGTPIKEIPLASRIDNYDSVNMVLTFCGNRSYEYFISYGQAKHGVKVGAGMTAVMASDAYPYYGAGQLTGLIAGLKGAAEYEELIGFRDEAFIGMDAQSITHILIVLFIVIGNIAFFVTKGKADKGRLSVRR